jgi:hypothetical protein
MPTQNGRETRTCSSLHTRPRNSNKSVFLCVRRQEVQGACTGPSGDPRAEDSGRTAQASRPDPRNEERKSVRHQGQQARGHEVSSQPCVHMCTSQAARPRERVSFSSTTSVRHFLSRTTLELPQESVGTQLLLPD